MLTFAVTEALADRYLWLSNAALIAGAVLILIGTIGAIAMSSAKEHFANERISANEADTARANEAAARANEGAVKAQLALEKYKATRASGLKEGDLNLAVAELKAFSGTKFDAGIPVGNDECRQLLTVLEDVLRAAGFSQIDWKDAKAGAIGLERKGRPRVGAVTARGVMVEVDAKKHPDLWKVAQAMEKAFKDAGVEMHAFPEIATGAVNDCLHLLVGEKTA